MQICALIDLENIGHAAVLPLLDGLAQPLHVVVFLGAKQKINGLAAALLERPHSFTQQNAALVEETSAAATSLQQLAQKLETDIRAFRTG